MHTIYKVYAQICFRLQSGPKTHALDALVCAGQRPIDQTARWFLAQLSSGEWRER